jgi:nucleoside 2-deoxyribosyltransferase
MRAFVSYRHTGESEDSIKPLLEAVRETLAARGVSIHNTFFDVREGRFDKPGLEPKEFMREAFKMMDRSDFLLVLQTSEERSEGMLMEVGYAIAKQLPVVVATRSGVAGTYLPQMGSLSFQWGDEEQLRDQLGRLDLAAIAK